MNTPTPQLSVVIPLYQAAECVVPLWERLQKSLTTLHPDYEVLLIDDGSMDASWLKAKEVASKDAHVKAIRLSRNFGQHYAITAGLEFSRGKWVVVMDCDLQDAPEDIPKLYQKALEGYDVVYAQQEKIYSSGGFRIISRGYHKLIEFLTRDIRHSTMGSFSLISRKVVDSFLQMNDAQRHYLILLRYLGFRHAMVPVARYARASGRSSYTWAKLFTLALDGIIAQSNILLRWSVQIGLISAFGSVLFMFRIVYYRITRPALPIGWSSLMATLLLLGGLILMSLGVLGIYIEKMFLQTKNRPLFFIDEKINCS